MRKLIFVAILMLPTSLLADHVDVIEGQLNEDCSQQKYMAIVTEFNEKWGEKNAYQAEVLFPIQSNNMTSMFWVGRSASTAAFGVAFDQWVKDLTDPDSLASSLAERFGECSTNLGRRGYMSY